MTDRYAKIQAATGLAGIIAIGSAVVLSPHSPVLILSVGALAAFFVGGSYFVGYRAAESKRTLQLAFALASWAVAILLLSGAWFIAQQMAAGYVPA